MFWSSSPAHIFDNTCMSITIKHILYLTWYCLGNIIVNLLISLSFVNSIGIKSGNCSERVEGLIVHLVVYLIATSCNMSLLYCTRIQVSFMIELLGTLLTVSIWSFLVRLHADMSNRNVWGVFWSFWNKNHLILCNVPSFTHQRKVLMKMLMNTISTTSAELSLFERCLY